MDKRKSLISKYELAVLKCLGNSKSESFRNNGITEVHEISFNTGIRDNDEVMRALYTLEGKCLVSPLPVGDFTSSKWHITEFGVKALELFHE